MTAVLLSRWRSVLELPSFFGPEPRPRAGAASRARVLDAEHRGLLGWALGYALVALLCGAAGAVGIASGMSLLPLARLLALSALALAASLLLGIAVVLAVLGSLPRTALRRPS
jgi:hypothetical protein